MLPGQVRILVVLLLMQQPSKIWTKFGQHFDKIWTKFRQNLDNFLKQFGKHFETNLEKWITFFGNKMWKQTFGKDGNNFGSEIQGIVAYFYISSALRASNRHRAKN